jgi:hypothetical protein
MFKIVHETKRVLVRCTASFETLQRAQLSAKNHGYEFVIERNRCVMGNILRPNYSSVAVAIRAASIVCQVKTVQLDVSWLPRLAVSNDSSTIIGSDDKTQDLSFDNRGCQNCLIYLSRCYCVDKAA